MVKNQAQISPACETGYHKSCRHDGGMCPCECHLTPIQREVSEKK